jgi:A/G-specific adenine glycosylase
MLQQTQASRVAPIFEAFLVRFPTPRALASAPVAEAVRAWEGLGYHRRAVALHRAAAAIVARHDGAVPSDVADLLALPGVGPYTANAVVAIAFGARVSAVDTNLRRIVSRVVAGAEPDEVSATWIGAAADAWVPARSAGDWNQAMMDLGRERCRPRNPRCDGCPLAPRCVFARAGRTGRSSVRPQAPFEGSFRQIRGDVLRILRDRPSATLAALSEASDRPRDRVARAVEALEADGIIERRGGRVRLAGSRPAEGSRSRSDGSVRSP